MTDLLGLPTRAWGVACLAIAVVWVFVWPSDRVAGAGAVRYALVRWGHSLCWILLALTCFLHASATPAVAGVANVAGLASLVVYVAFMAATFRFR